MAVQIERDEFLRTFQAYTNRYRHSYEASYSTNPLYYSTDIGRAAPALLRPCCAQMLSNSAAALSLPFSCTVCLAFLRNVASALL